jgi:hypothetical protein
VAKVISDATMDVMADCLPIADRILSLITEELRKAFVAGVIWSNWFEYMERPSQAELERYVEAEAARRYGGKEAEK